MTDQGQSRGTPLREPLRAAVVGAGFGGGLSMAALDRSERYELVAACDLREEARAAVESRYPGLHTYRDHRTLLAEAQIDVVCVATLPPTHEAIVDDALASPVRGLLIEKPLGDTAAAGQRIVRAVRERGVPAAVPHNLAVAPHAREIVACVHAGEIGELKLVEIQNRGWDIINAGIHWLNFFVTLAHEAGGGAGRDAGGELRTNGDPAKEVMALADRSTRTHRDGMQVETLAVTSVQTRSGLRAIMHTGDHTHVNAANRDCCFRLVGTHGLIEFWGWPSCYSILNAAHPRGTLVEVPPGDAPGHQLHLDTLADEIAEGCVDLRALECSLEALEICEGAYRSSREGRIIALPLGDDAPPPPIEWDPGRPYAGSGGGRDGRCLEDAA